MLASIKDYLQTKVSISSEKPVVKAYDIWSHSYDAQPGNLVLDLDEMIFSTLLEDIDLEHKLVADIGCGTGRHWQKISRALSMDILLAKNECMSQMFKIQSRNRGNNRVMKKTTAFLPLILSAFLCAMPLAEATSSIQQQTPPAVQAQLEAMKKLSWMLGEWRGEGWIEFGPGNRRTFKQSE